MEQASRASKVREKVEQAEQTSGANQWSKLQHGKHGGVGERGMSAAVQISEQTSCPFLDAPLHLYERVC